jgi:hypothetical protein
VTRQTQEKVYRSEGDEGGRWMAKRQSEMRKQMKGWKRERERRWWIKSKVT